MLQSEIGAQFLNGRYQADRASNRVIGSSIDNDGRQVVVLDLVHPNSQRLGIE